MRLHEDPVLLWIFFWFTFILLLEACKHVY